MSQSGSQTGSGAVGQGGGVAAGETGVAAGGNIEGSSIHISTAAHEESELHRRIKDLEIAMFGDRRTGYPGGVTWIERLRDKTAELREEIDELKGRQNAAQLVTLALATVSTLGILIILLRGG